MRTHFLIIFFLMMGLMGSLHAQVASPPLMQPHALSACSGTFVPHELDHTTQVGQKPVRFFDSNGAGLAINDLNNDGLLDIVLANLDGQESILWNTGSLQFRQQILNIPGKTRAVITVDMDADGWQDIVFSSQRGAPSLWRNTGAGNFVFAPLPGIRKAAYTLNIADMDADGDLDVVTASYDAEMERIDGSYLLSGGAGVYYYENQAGDFIGTRLTDRSQALAIYLGDLDGDAQPDIAIGNDFAEPDAYWTRRNDTWERFEPFSITTMSTMSFASGDINNDGSPEFYATDMHPYQRDPATMRVWQPILDDLLRQLTAADRQKITNVLQVWQDNEFQNRASHFGIQHTGWSWSAQFGDLDSDGFLDLYVVNGMIAADILGHLPNAELVENNRAFRNVAGEKFEPAPEWSLNAAESGRGMTLGDLDNDGDLDIVVNNLLSPSMLYENQLCGGSNLTLDIRQLNSQNPHSIGTRIRLTTSTGIYQREIVAASGYLSGNASRVHFGFPQTSQLKMLEIIQVDGTVTQIDDLEPNMHLSVELPNK